MKDNGISSHAIFIKDDLLVSVFEYDGDSYDEDMQRIADHPVTRAWWEKTAPMQKPLENRDEGEWWTFLDPLTSYE
jgi:L-rhamnose mutarotase